MRERQIDRSDVFDKPIKKKSTTTENVITAKLAVGIDRTKMSDRKVTLVICETVQSLGRRIYDFNINWSCIKRNTKKYQDQITKDLKEKLSRDIPLMFHSKRIIMSDVPGNQRMNRLPIRV